MRFTRHSCGRRCGIRRSRPRCGGEIGVEKGLDGLRIGGEMLLLVWVQAGVLGHRCLLNAGVECRGGSSCFVVHPVNPVFQRGLHLVGVTWVLGWGRPRQTPTNQAQKYFAQGCRCLKPTPMLRPAAQEPIQRRMRLYGLPSKQNIP